MKKIPVSALFLSLLFSACGVKTDSELKKAVNAIVENCNIDLRYTTMKNCKNKEKENFTELSKAKGVIPSINTLSVLFKDSDIKTATTASGLLYEVRRRMGNLDKVKDQIDKRAVSNLIDGIRQMQGYAAFYAAEITMKLATITGQENEAIKVFENHPEEAVKNQGYRYLMTFARLKNFDRVKKLASKENHKYTRAAAVAAAEYMYKYTDDEKKEICPWAKGFLDDEESSVSGSAARILLQRCAGENIDVVLDKGEALAKDDALIRSMDRLR